jgi:hypothetical protein
MSADSLTPGVWAGHGRRVSVAKLLVLSMSRGNAEVEAISSPPGIAIFSALVKQLPNYGQGESLFYASVAPFPVCCLPEHSVS